MNEEVPGGGSGVTWVTWAEGMGFESLVAVSQCASCVQLCIQGVRRCDARDVGCERMERLKTACKFLSKTALFCFLPSGHLISKLTEQKIRICVVFKLVVCVCVWGVFRNSFANFFFFLS